MQLLVAQQIIHQEKLKDNIMLYGYVDNNTQFLDIYDLMIIDVFWDYKILMHQVCSWSVISRKHLIRDCKATLDNYKFFLKIINKYRVDSVYFGEITNNCYHLAAMCFHHIGLKVCFFEEGSSHYVNNLGNSPKKSIFDKCFGMFIDMFYFRPFFKVSYGRIHFNKGVELSDIPMDTRYSIVPLYHESFDKLLLYQPLFSKKLKMFLENEITRTDNNSILLLTSPFYINGVDDNPDLYIKTIIDFVNSLDKANTLHIKFHPRETIEVRNRILGELDKNEIKYVQLGKKYNIPVEYYLQYNHYEKIVMFLCSTYFYNGYLYPKTKFESILKAYYNNCLAAGTVHVKFIEPLLKHLPEE